MLQEDLFRTILFFSVIFLSFLLIKIIFTFFVKTFIFSLRKSFNIKKYLNKKGIYDSYEIQKIEDFLKNFDKNKEDLENAIDLFNQIHREKITKSKEIYKEIEKSVEEISFFTKKNNFSIEKNISFSFENDDFNLNHYFMIIKYKNHKDSKKESSFIKNISEINFKNSNLDFLEKGVFISKIYYKEFMFILLIFFIIIFSVLPKENIVDLIGQLIFISIFIVLLLYIKKYFDSKIKMNKIGKNFYISIKDDKNSEKIKNFFDANLKDELEKEESLEVIKLYNDKIELESKYNDSIVKSKSIIENYIFIKNLKDFSEKITKIYKRKN